MSRLVEKNVFGDKDDKYRYGVSRFPDGKGAKWKINENKQ